jgi:hypothetical protein
VNTKEQRTQGYEDKPAKPPVENMELVAVDEFI